MSITIKVLQKVLVNYFYKVNAGLFAFCFFVLFGLPYAPLTFHLSIINGIINSYEFLAVVLFIWIVFNLKCINYVLKQLRDQHQTFLFCLNCLPPFKLFLQMLYVQALVYMPVLLYAFAITIIAFKKQQPACALIVIFFSIIITGLTAVTYVFTLRRTSFVNVSLSLPILSTNFCKPVFLIPLYFMWHHHKQMVLLTKAFTLFILYLFIALYEPEAFDVRPLQLCLLLVAASNCSIVFEIRNFELKYLSFLRSLPIPIARRFVHLIIMFVILLLPELLLMLKGLQTQFMLFNYPKLLLLPVSLMCLFYAVLLIEETSMDELVKIVFGISAACFFIILYNPGMLLPIAVLLLAFALFNSYYFS